jgi:hypothetical protein
MKPHLPASGVRGRRWCGALTQLALALFYAASPLGTPSLAAQQESDYQSYSEPPRLILNARRVRLLRRERERESLRWQQFEALMSGKARMPEPGFASALWGVVTSRAAPCKEATDWAVKSAGTQKPDELRQAALVYDWCATSAGDTQSALLARKLAPALAARPVDAPGVRSLVFAALAIADVEPQASEAALRYSIEEWWRKRTVPRLKAGESPFARREDLYAMTEFLHAIRDNLRSDLREDASRWFEDLPPVELLSYYPLPYPAPENEFRIPAYLGSGEPDLREAALSRATELALVAYDGNSNGHQFMQGWLLQDRFLMRGAFGITYEFLWANPYLPGLSFKYMPDFFHARRGILMRDGWEEDATWFGYWDGNAQLFRDGKRVSIRLDARPAPVRLGSVKIFFASSGMKFETGWGEPPSEDTKPMRQTAFVVGLEPETGYNVEIDDEEMCEARTDKAGILEFSFAPDRKTTVRIAKYIANVR